MNTYLEPAIILLKLLISTPSYSKEEDKTAEIIKQFLTNNGLKYSSIGNNIVSILNEDEVSLPLVILNSHHDTVRPNTGYTRDPFDPEIVDGRLFGLGSNDAGGALVSYLMAFLHFSKMKSLPYRLGIIVSAEEEISGKNGLQLVLDSFSHDIALALVGEPTGCQMAIAEKGLMVVDATARGVAGHAAHYLEDNAILNAVNDIQKLNEYEFTKISELLGKVKITTTQINAGVQHNVQPDICTFVIDCRINEHYTNEEVLVTLRSICQSALIPRSTHLSSSKIPIQHPIVQRGIAMSLGYYGSPTMSDQVFFKCPSIKIGPGESIRSHQVDEYILISEIDDGIKTIINLLKDLKI